MRSPHLSWPILHRYIFREVLSPFLVSLFVFTGILFLVRSLKLIDLVVNKSVPALDMLLLFGCIIPRFLEIALPMSLLIGTILAFSRLSAASELVVMRATGVSLKQLAYPVMVFAVAACLISAVMSFWIRPWANYRFGVGTFEIAKRQATSGLVPGVFNDLGQLTVYAAAIDQQTGRLKDVIIADRREPETTRNFLARYGQIVSDDAERTLSVRLYDGSIHEGSGLTYNATYFDVNNINIDQDELLDNEPARAGKKNSEMTIGEAFAALGAFEEHPEPPGQRDILRRAALDVEIQRRFALPAACLAVAIIAMALGVQPNRGGRSWGVTANVFVGILVILLYYLGFAFADALGMQAAAPAWVLMWLPNLVFGAAALALLSNLESEAWLNLSEHVAAFVRKAALNLRLVDAQHPGRSRAHEEAAVADV